MSYMYGQDIISKKKKTKRIKPKLIIEEETKKNITLKSHMKIYYLKWVCLFQMVNYIY